MIDLILEMPRDLQIILGSGLIMVLYDYLKREVWEKSKQKEGLSSIKKIPERYVNFKNHFFTKRSCRWQNLLFS